jgi:hypothetical protein
VAEQMAATVPVDMLHFVMGHLAVGMAVVRRQV